MPAAPPVSVGRRRQTPLHSPTPAIVLLPWPPPPSHFSAVPSRPGRSPVSFTKLHPVGVVLQCPTSVGRRCRRFSSLTPHCRTLCRAPPCSYVPLSPGPPPSQQSTSLPSTLFPAFFTVAANDDSSSRLVNGKLPSCPKFGPRGCFQRWSRASHRHDEQVKDRKCEA